MEEKTTVAIYVDDFLILTNDHRLVIHIKQQLCAEFMMKDLGPVKQVLGSPIWSSDGVVVIDQEQYVDCWRSSICPTAMLLATAMDLNQRLTKKMCPVTEKREEEYEEHSVQRTRWRIIVCCAVYQAGYQSCGKSSQQFFQQPWTNALDSSQKDTTVLEGCEARIANVHADRRNELLRLQRRRLGQRVRYTTICERVRVPEEWQRF